MLARLPAALSERLGREASGELVDVLNALAERFEANLRTEIRLLGAQLREEMANTRFELLKWMFLFWVGQVATMTAIFSFLLSRRA